MNKYIELSSADASSTWYKLRLLHTGFRTPRQAPSDIQRALDGSGSLSIGADFYTLNGVARVNWTEPSDYATFTLLKKWMSDRNIAKRTMKLRTFYYVDAGTTPLEEIDCVFRSLWDPEHAIPAHDQGFAYYPIQLEGI